MAYFGVPPKVLLKLFLIISPLMLSSTTLNAKAGYYEPWGRDADLKIARETPISTLTPLVMIADKIIRFHQTVINPIDGPRSHFRPTSSKYMQLAIRKYGFFKGFVMGCDRLLRENDADWVYRTIEIEGKLYKHDPVR